MENKKIEFNSLKIEELEDLFLSLGERSLGLSNFLDLCIKRKTLK